MGPGKYEETSGAMCGLLCRIAILLEFKMQCRKFYPLLHAQRGSECAWELSWDFNSEFISKVETCNTTLTLSDT